MHYLIERLPFIIGYAQIIIGLWSCYLTYRLFISILICWDLFYVPDYHTYIKGNQLRLIALIFCGLFFVIFPV
jgi:hypothetical protein